MDRTALEALRRAPGLDLLLKKLASLHFERQVRLHFTAGSLRLGPNQCPQIYELLQEACAVLDIAEPELYLLQQPFPNAFAIGMERHTLVISSGLTELLDTDELRHVIGHELGHFKSGHMLYRTMAIFLSLIGIMAARNLPFVNLLTQALIYAFYDWSRKSELTADRAGLLVSQNPEIGIRTLLKLAGGAQASTDTLSIQHFLKQADEFEEMGTNLLDAIYIFEMTRFQSHPFPALRAREIDRWSKSEEYRQIMMGNYPMDESATESTRRCPKCAALVPNLNFRFCPECGGPL